MTAPDGPAGRDSILVEDLVVRYGDKRAVDGLSFRVRPGETLALLGPNGAGKSSTVRCLVGLQVPDAGRLELAGHPLAGEAREARRRLAYVPENAELYEVLTPREILLLRGRLFGLDDPLCQARAEHLCEVLGILDRIDSPTGGFSKGMRQKVVLATALLTGPEVLVLDEPLSGLDAETTQLVKALLLELKRQGRAILYCSHMLDVVEKVADRVLILDHGRPVAEGTVSELAARAQATGDPGLETIFRVLTLGADPEERARKLLAMP
ncbi:MAG: ABC transporter ATP-binding protein [Planctomycetota bacterium]